MVQGIDGLVLVELLHSGVLLLVVGLLHLLHEGLELSKLDQQWLVGQVLDVLGIVVGLVGRAPFVHLLEALGLVRVDPFQDT